jgi:hypothetical protein
VINLKDSRREHISVAKSSVPKSSPQAITAPDEERKHDPKRSNSPHETATVAGAKRPFEADDNTSEGPSTRAKTEAGPSTLKVIAKPLRPEHLPDEVLLVVPPMLKSLYEDLSDDSLTEPESSENKRDIRKAEMKALN